MADPVYDDAKKRWTLENVEGTADEPKMIEVTMAEPSQVRRPRARAKSLSALPPADGARCTALLTHPAPSPHAAVRLRLQVQVHHPHHQGQGQLHHPR